MMENCPCCGTLIEVVAVIHLNPMRANVERIIPAAKSSSVEKLLAFEAASRGGEWTSEEPSWPDNAPHVYHHTYLKDTVLAWYNPPEDCYRHKVKDRITLMPRNSPELAGVPEV